MTNFVNESISPREVEREQMKAV